jgi:EmrB/QacA subfamily drug resistance transporter
VPELFGSGSESLARRLLTEPARPDRIRNLPRAPWLAVATVCIGAFMGQLDASIVTLALPALRTDLHIGLGLAEWVSLSYLLVLVGSVIAVGRIADVAGRKLLYVYGFGLFTLASLGCGLAPNLAVLLIMRVVQAVGAALLQANSVALIRTTVRPDQLNRAIGLQGAAQALGLALGPAVGGLLIAAGGWRWVFWVNLPIGAVGIVLGLLLLPRTRVRAARTPFDLAGFATLLPAAALLLLGLSLLDGHLLLGCLLVLVAVLGLGCFVRAERRSAAPLVDLALFRARPFRAGVLSGLLGYLVLFGALLVSPLFIEAHLHYSAGRAGLLVTLLPLALAVLAPLAGRAADRYGQLPVTVTGLVVAAAGFSCAAALPSRLVGLVLMLVLVGAGLGIFTPANNAAVAGSGRMDQAGLVSGVLNMTRGVGTALGVAAAGATYGLAGPHPVAGLRDTMLLLGVLALLGAWVSATGRPA